jgi:hypothetical protein
MTFFHLNNKIMKNYFLILLGLLFMTVSCQDEAVISDDNLSPSNEALLVQCLDNFNHYQADLWVTLPKRGHNGNAVTKKIVFHPSSGTFGVIPNLDACGDFPHLQMFIEGGGTATHLGAYSVVNLACVDESGAFLSPVLGFITAANGDVIHTQMGIPYPDLDNPPNFYYPYTIIGGSEGGRFESATGYVMMYGIVDYETATWNLIGEGEITY